MLRIAVPILPLLVTPAFAHDGLHHHPHGIEFGWLTWALLTSVVWGGVVYAVKRRRK